MMFRISGVLAILLAASMALGQRSIGEQGDRTERFLRTELKPERPPRSKGGAPESSFKERGVRRIVTTTSWVAQPGYSYSTRSQSWGLTLLSSTTPRARYYYVDRQLGKPLDAEAQPTDDPTQVRYFDGTAAGSSLFMGSYVKVSTRSGFKFERWSGLGSVQLNSDDDYFQFSANLFYSQTVHADTFWSASLDITDGRTFPGIALTFSPSHNWVSAPDDYFDRGWTYDLTADMSLDLGFPRPIALTLGYTFPSRFGGEFDYYVRVAFRLGDGPQIRLKLSKDNIYGFEAVHRFSLR